MSFRPNPKKYNSKDEILEDLKGGKDYIYVVHDVLMGSPCCPENCFFRKECELFSEQGRDYSCKETISAAILSMRDSVKGHIFFKKYMIKKKEIKTDYLIDSNFIMKLNQVQWGIVNFLAHKLHFAAAPYEQPKRYTEEDFAPFAVTHDLSHAKEKNSF